MELVECKGCGSRELADEDGIVVCGYCQTRYVPGPKDAPTPQTVIGVGSDIQNLLQKCQDDPANSRRYASLVLDLDPSNKSAKEILNPTRNKKNRRR
jgi:hypothetical protein